MSKFLMGREESLFHSPIQKLALWRRAWGKPSGYRKRSATRNSSSTTGKKAKVVQGKKNSKWWSTTSVSTTSRGRGVFSNSFSSYSSERQISSLSESVATDHFRQVGSFSTVSDEGPRQESLASRRGSHSSAERCCRISEPSSYSRFLFPPFSCTKENGKMRPVIDLSVLN